eukprot:s4457_g3.t1
MDLEFDFQAFCRGFLCWALLETLLWMIVSAFCSSAAPFLDTEYFLALPDVLLLLALLSFALWWMLQWMAQRWIAWRLTTINFRLLLASGNTETITRTWTRLELMESPEVVRLIKSELPYNGRNVRLVNQDGSLATHDSILHQELAAALHDHEPSQKAGLHGRALLLGSEPDVDAAVPLLAERLNCQRATERPSVPILDVLDSTSFAVLAGPEQPAQPLDCRSGHMALRVHVIDQDSQSFDYVMSLELLDGLSVKDLSSACNATLATLRPGGLAMFVSEEPEAFGSLKRAMRGLRPAAEARLSVRSIAEELRIHVYRRAQGEDGEWG